MRVPGVGKMRQHGGGEAGVMKMALGSVGEQDYSSPPGLIAFTMLKVLPALEILTY